MDAIRRPEDQHLGWPTGHIKSPLDICLDSMIQVDLQDTTGFTLPQNEFIPNDPEPMIDPSLQLTCTDLNALSPYSSFPFQFPLHNLNTNQPSQSSQPDFQFQGVLLAPLPRQSAHVLQPIITLAVTEPPYFTNSPLSGISTTPSLSLPHTQKTTFPPYHINELRQYPRLPARTKTNIKANIRPNINRSKPLPERSGPSDSVYGQAAIAAAPSSATTAFSLPAPTPSAGATAFPTVPPNNYNTAFPPQLTTNTTSPPRLAKPQSVQKSPQGPQPRVAKAIRMRVRRPCVCCGKLFVGKVCTACGRCVRYPSDKASSCASSMDDLSRLLGGTRMREKNSPI